MLEWNEPLAKRSAKVKGASDAWQTRRIIKLTPTRARLAISYINAALCVHIIPYALPIEIRSAVRSNKQTVMAQISALFNANPPVE
jgi:hypothetical protein